MRAGDIEIRIRGHGLDDIPNDQLLEFAAAAARLFPGAELVRARQNCIVLRPRKRAPGDMSCDSAT